MGYQLAGEYVLGAKSNVVITGLTQIVYHSRDVLRCPALYWMMRAQQVMTRVRRSAPVTKSGLYPTRYGVLYSLGKTLDLN